MFGDKKHERGDSLIGTVVMTNTSPKDLFSTTS